MIRWLALALLLCVSCATTTRQLSHRLCRELYVGHDYSIRGETAEALVRAVRYWRSVANVPMHYGGFHGQVHVALAWPDDSGRSALAPPIAADVRWYTLGRCVTRAFIRLAPTTLNRPVEHRESILRHELGHVIGLPDSENCSDVMGCHEPESTVPPYPRDVSPVDRELLMRAYR